MEPHEEEHREVVTRGPVTPGAAPVTPVAAGVAVTDDYYARRSETVVRTYDRRTLAVVWFITGVLAALIAIRFFMKLLGASYQADFVRFMYGVTDPLVAPFRGIFAESGQGSYVLEPASLVAIAIYALIGWAIVALVRIMTAPRARPTLR